MKDYRNGENIGKYVNSIYVPPQFRSDEMADTHYMDYKQKYVYFFLIIAFIDIGKAWWYLNLCRMLALDVDEC